MDRDGQMRVSALGAKEKRKSARLSTGSNLEFSPRDDIIDDKLAGIWANYRLWNKTSFVGHVARSRPRAARRETRHAKRRERAQSLVSFRQQSVRIKIITPVLIRKLMNASITGYPVQCPGNEKAEGRSLAIIFILSCNYSDAWPSTRVFFVTRLANSIA